jgi:hypothetical protein
MGIAPPGNAWPFDQVHHDKDLPEVRAFIEQSRYARHARDPQYGNLASYAATDMQPGSAQDLDRHELTRCFVARAPNLAVCACSQLPRFMLFFS